MGWLLLLGGGVLFLLSRSGAPHVNTQYAPQANPNTMPWLPAPLPAGMVRWTAGMVGSGSTFITEAEAMQRAEALGMGAAAGYGLGFLWFRS